MASQDPSSIITQALLDLYQANADEAKAQLQLQTASAKKAALGRSAVPGVFAQLQANREKEAKRREAAGKTAGKEGQAAAKSRQMMVPQVVPPTGVPEGGAGGMKAIAELFGKGISAGGPQPAAERSRVAASGMPPMQASGAPPGMAQQTTTTQQQVTRGEEPFGHTARRMALDRMFGRGTGAQMFGEPPVTITETVTAPIDIPKMTEPFAKKLAVFQARMGDPDPAVSQVSEQEYVKYREEIRTELAKTLGSPELADHAVDTMEDQAANIRLFAEEAERLKNLDPVETAKRDEARTNSMIAALEQGLITGEIQESDLTPGQLIALKQRRKGVEVGAGAIQVVMPATANELEKRSINHYDVLGKINAMETAIGSGPDAYRNFFRRGEGVKVAAMREQSKTLGIPMDPKQTAQAQRFDAAVKAFNSLTADFVKQFGATLTPKEMEIAVGQIPTPDLSYEEYLSSVGNLRHITALDLYRDTMIRGVGFPAADKTGDALPLANTAEEARKALRVHTQELIDGTPDQPPMEPAAAAVQASKDFRDTWGFDVNRLQATNPTLGF